MDILRLITDHCVYVKTFAGDMFIILLLYVDHMLMVGWDAKMIGNLKNELSKSYDMIDLGPVEQILSLQIL